MKVVNIRLEDELLNRLQKLASMEYLDRTNMIKKLLRKSTQEELINKALERYVHGEITLAQAAELAETTPWDIISIMVLRGIHHRGTGTELRLETQKRLKELGYERLAEAIGS